MLIFNAEPINRLHNRKKIKLRDNIWRWQDSVELGWIAGLYSWRGHISRWVGSCSIQGIKRKKKKVRTSNGYKGNVLFLFLGVWERGPLLYSHIHNKMTPSGGDCASLNEKRKAKKNKEKNKQTNKTSSNWSSYDFQKAPKRTSQQWDPFQFLFSFKVLTKHYIIIIIIIEEGKKKTTSYL